MILNDNCIQRVNKFKFLECYTDSTQSWSDPINHVITQNSKVVAILRLAI